VREARLALEQAEEEAEEEARRKRLQRQREEEVEERIARQRRLERERQEEEEERAARARRREREAQVHTPGRERGESVTIINNTYILEGGEAPLSPLNTPILTRRSYHAHLNRPPSPRRRPLLACRTVGHHPHCRSPNPARRLWASGEPNAAPPWRRSSRRDRRWTACRRAP
jgi:hypothetical protein